MNIGRHRFPLLLAFSTLVALMLSGCGGGQAESQDATLASPGGQLANPTGPAIKALAAASTIQITLTSSSVSRATAAAGQVQSVQASIESNTDVQDLWVELRIVDSQSVTVARRTFQSFALSAEVARSLQFDYQVPADLPVGRYSAQIGVWNPTSWETYLYEQIAVFDVTGAPTAPMSLVNSSVSQKPLLAGQLQTVKATIRSTTDRQGLYVAIRILDSQSTIVAFRAFENLSLTAGTATPLQFDYQSPANLPPGRYSAVVGVWNATTWDTYLYEEISSFDVTASTGSGWGSDPDMPLITVTSAMPDFLQVGHANHAYWIEDGEWGAGALTRGTYTGLDGSQYESAYARSLAVGPNGEVAWRSAWKWPTGTTEVKSYPSAIFGAKPGFYNPSNTPGGYQILLPDGTYSTTAPSGATPGTFLPLPANGALPAINSSFAYKHLVTPSGRGQLTYDIWLQSTPGQTRGFGEAPKTHEIMIPLDYWGNYGAHGYRNPGWYSHDVTLEGRLWHVYMARNFGGTWDPQTQTSTGGWTFVVFEPDAPLSPNSVHTLNLSTFINYLATRSDAKGPWAHGTEHLVSVELGVEPQDGVGDIEVFNYRVWRP